MSEIDTCAPECGERDPKPNTPDPSTPNPIFPDPSAKDPRPRRDLAEVGGAEEERAGDRREDARLPQGRKVAW